MATHQAPTYPSSWQTWENLLQLLKHNSLLGRIGISLSHSVPNADTSITTGRVNDGGLSGKSCRSTGLDIRGRRGGSSVDPRKRELKVSGRGAGTTADGRIVDVEPDAAGKIRLARCNESLSDIGREVGINSHVGSECCCPRYLWSSGATESSARDTFLRSLGCCTYGAWDLELPVISVHSKIPDPGCRIWSQKFAQARNYASNDRLQMYYVLRCKWEKFGKYSQEQCYQDLLPWMSMIIIEGGYS